MPDNVTVSEKPWSDYSKADYTPEQWHAACLIHQHEGAPTSKEQCKLPVRTPNGTLNRNGVHAAAAALAGARGGVDATPAEKSAAARAIVRLYGQLDEKAPPSMMALMHQEEVDESLAHFGVKGMKWNLRKTATALATSEGKVTHSESLLDNFLKHYGVKGMKWGVRKDDSAGGSKAASPSKKEVKIAEAAKDAHVSEDAIRFIKTTQKQGHEMSDREIREAVNRANMMQQYDKFFGPQPNAELQAKVNRMNLEKEYGQLQSELHPSAKDRVDKFLRGSRDTIDSFNKLNESTNGLLGDTIYNNLVPRTAAPQHRIGGGAHRLR